MTVTRINRYPSEAEILELVRFIQILTIFISDDGKYELTSIENPKEVTSAKALVKDLTGDELEL